MLFVRAAAAVLALFIAVPALVVPTQAAPAAKQPQVKVTDEVVGTGAVATPYSTVSVHYTGWLMNGKKFDSSLDRGKPFSFTIDGGEVIMGWDQGVQGMKVGGKRVLIVPPELGYGAHGAGNVIPPNATLKFEVQLLAVKPPRFTRLDDDQLKAMMARGVVLIDIRLPEEWKQTGVIKGSHLITAFTKEGRLDPAFHAKFDEVVKSPTQEFALICRTGSRSGYLANFLSSKAGYKKVFDVRHGITKWIAEKRPVVQP